MTTKTSISSGMITWFAVVKSTSLFTRVKPPLLIKKQPSEIYRPPNKTYQARALTVQVLCKICGDETAREWLHFCANYSYNVITNLCKRDLMEEEIYAVYHGALALMQDDLVKEFKQRGYLR